MLCDDPEGWDGDGREAREGWDICMPMVNSCCCAEETNTVL